MKWVAILLGLLLFPAYLLLLRKLYPRLGREDTNLSGFDDFGFWDAYLLAVREGKDMELDMYVHLCGDATLVFPNARRVRWVEKRMKPNVDPDGTVDYGLFEWVGMEQSVFRVSGDFGELEVESDHPFARRAKDFSGWK